jgi:two-component system, OmpR family, phosphate regulon sensor histidine kinase PhoR
MLRSIRWRIAFPYVLLVLLVMLGLGAYLSLIIRESYLERLDTQLTDAALLVSDAVTPALKNNNGKGSMDQSAQYYASMLGMRVTIIAPDGTVLGESEEPSAQLDNHLTRPEVAQAIARGKGSSIRLSNTLNIQMYYLAVIVKSGQQRLAS